MLNSLYKRIIKYNLFGKFIFLLIVGFEELENRLRIVVDICFYI